MLKEKKIEAKRKKEAPKVEQVVKKTTDDKTDKTDKTETNKTDSSSSGGTPVVEEYTKVEKNVDDEFRKNHVSKRKRYKNVVRKKIKKFAKSKPFTFIALQRRNDIPKYHISDQEKDLMQRMTFVKSGKKVERLAKRQKMLQVPVVAPPPEPEPVAQQELPVELTAEEKRQQKFAKYFDKSRRISRSINEDDMDSLFDSHLSEAYMDIDIDRHLNIGKKFNKRLYSMASKVLAHGEIKITDDADLSVKANRKAWLKKKSKEEYKRMMREGEEYEDFLDDEIEQDNLINDYIYENYDDELPGERIVSNTNLSAKNILVVDSLLYRDRKRSRESRLGRTRRPIKK